MSKPTKPRPRQLSRAQLKAYEARRASEANHDGAPVTRAAVATRAVPSNRRVHALSRAEEYAIIRSDLRRLLWILAVLTVTLLVLTFFLR